MRDKEKKNSALLCKIFPRKVIGTVKFYYFAHYLLYDTQSLSQY